MAAKVSGASGTSQHFSITWTSGLCVFMHDRNKLPTLKHVSSQVFFFRRRFDSLGVVKERWAAARGMRLVTSSHRTKPKLKISALTVWNPSCTRRSPKGWIPKSLTTLCVFTKMFLVHRSPWWKPRSWRYCMASQICNEVWRTSSSLGLSWMKL